MTDKAIICLENKKKHVGFGVWYRSGVIFVFSNTLFYQNNNTHSWIIFLSLIVISFTALKVLKILENQPNSFLNSTRICFNFFFKVRHWIYFKKHKCLNHSQLTTSKWRFGLNFCLRCINFETVYFSLLLYGLENYDNYLSFLPRFFVRSFNREIVSLLN